MGDLILYRVVVELHPAASTQVVKKTVTIAAPIGRVRRELGLLGEIGVAGVGEAKRIVGVSDVRASRVLSVARLGDATMLEPEASFVGGGT